MIIRRAAAWLEDRTGLGAVVRRLAEHPVPVTTDWRYVLGSATLTAFLLQVVTGAALATVYVPSASHAYQSLQFITHDAPFGRVLRGLHYFGASAMMILIGAHMARVYLTGSYKFPREVNWLSGVALLLLTTMMAFTGQLLRWDQGAIWSAVVGAEQAGRVPLAGSWIAHLILGGNTLGAPTLTRSFAVHVFLLPALIFGGVGLHIYLVLRNGISEPPNAEAPTEGRKYRVWYQSLLAREGIPFWPDVAWRDVVFAVGIVAILVALAIAIGPAPLGLPPDPTNVHAVPRPDWYFLWYFALLAVLPKGIEPFVIVLAPLVVGIVLVALPFVAGDGDRRLRRRPWAVAIVVIALGTIAWFTSLGERAPWTPDFDGRPLVAAAIPARDSTGAQLFHSRGCEFCHRIGSQGGLRGPDLSSVSQRLNRAQMTSRILGGGTNMPAYATKLSPEELSAIVSFLEDRSASHGAAEMP